jgi:hypothetical protein
MKYCGSHLFIGLCFVFFSLSLSAQEEEKRPNIAWRYINYVFNDKGDPADSKVIVYPSFGYAPETRWEFGFSSLFVYYARHDTTNRLSDVSGFVFYTLENQYGFWFDHALYSHQNKWFFLGRTRFQNFPLLYFGIGPDSPAEQQALVNGQYTLIKERVLREVSHSFYAGLEVDYQRLDRVEFVQADPENPIEIPAGGEGSNNIGLGIGAVYDNRHNVLNVRQGIFSELAILHYSRNLGSDFEFSTLISDNRIFKKVRRNQVLAVQLFGQFSFGQEIPFNQLALMGGENLMRGYYLGRYRDRHLVAGQVEYRWLPFSFSKRLGAALFLGAGQVFSDENPFALPELVPAGGGGLRLLLFPKKDVFTRVDVAFTQEGPGIYFLIGESF